jgi:hypothetical protein
VMNESHHPAFGKNRALLKLLLPLICDSINDHE